MSRGARGSRGQRDDPMVKLSKSLSWLLRHGAEKEGFTFLQGGFLYVDDVLQKSQFKGFTVDDVKHVVDTNEKKRFHLETDEESGRLKIRANQGHTLEVPDLDLEPVTSADQLPVVLHGTFYKNWEAIRQQGLKRMKRTHIHFATGEPGQTGVISGMRASCNILIYLDLEKALAGGLKFFRSANNVILCEGNEDGVIPTSFFKRVVDRKTGAEVDLAAPGAVAGDAEGARAKLAGLLVSHRTPQEMMKDDEDMLHENMHRRKSRAVPSKMRK